MASTLKPSLKSLPRPPKQYAVVVSPELMTVLDKGLSRAMLDRMQRPDAVSPTVIDDRGEAFYRFSLKEQYIFFYSRGLHFTLDQLLELHLWLWDGAGYIVGTRKELDNLCAWAEHEQSYLLLNHLPFSQYRDRNDQLIPVQTISDMLVDLVDQIDNLCDPVTAMFLAPPIQPTKTLSSLIHLCKIVSGA